jgi:serine/threonine protein kinase
MVFSLVDQISHHILKTTFDKGIYTTIDDAGLYQQGTVIWKEQEQQLEMGNNIIPTWEETEAWKRHSDEWKLHMFLSSTDETHLLAVPPRIIVMDGKKRNVTLTLTRKQGTFTVALQLDYNMNTSEHNEHKHIVFDEAYDAIWPASHTPECVPMAEWQTKHFPTCNIVHEHDIVQGVRTVARTRAHKKSNDPKHDDDLRIELLGEGGMRLAWSASQHGSYVAEKIILKTLKWPRNYTASIYEHNRVDALVSERLTASPHVIDIYGFCGNAVLNEMAFSSMGKIAKHSNLTFTAMLEYVTQAAQGIADVQSIDYFHHRSSDSGSSHSSITNTDQCNSTVVHNDMGPSNFLVAKNGRVKLSDFNLSILQYWNTTSSLSAAGAKYDNSNNTQHQQCGFRHAHKCGVQGAMASPESCLERDSLTEKIDVYGLGSIIFFILTQGHVPYAFNEFSDDEPSDGRDNDNTKDNDNSALLRRLIDNKDEDTNRRREEAVATAIMQGVPPILSSELLALISSNQEQDDDDDDNGNMKAVRTMITVMRQAMLYHPQDRPTARTLADQLQWTLKELTDVQ